MCIVLWLLGFYDITGFRKFMWDLVNLAYCLYVLISLSCPNLCSFCFKNQWAFWKCMILKFGLSTEFVARVGTPQLGFCGLYH